MKNHVINGILKQKVSDPEIINKMFQLTQRPLLLPRNHHFLRALRVPAIQQPEWRLLCINSNLMKLFSIITVLAAAITCFSCSKSGPVAFTIENQAHIQIKSTVLVNIPSEIATPDVTTNSSEELSGVGSRPGLIKNTALKELRLTITNPEAKTFSFLKSVHIFISTSDDDKVEIAYLDDISADANTIWLITTGARLDKYIKGSSYKLRTQVTTREVLTENVDLLAEMKFDVLAGF